MINEDSSIYQLFCNNPDCGLVLATSGDPTPLQKRFVIKGCPYCSCKEFSTNYDITVFDEKEISINKLSVIIPFFGVEDFAKACIESVLAQDVSPLDVYLVDDGSCDTCPEICDSFLFDPRVVVIHQKNAGLSMARNTALELVHSEYVTFLDGDDKLLDNPNGYSRVIAALQETGADLAYYSYVLHAEDEEPLLPERLSHAGYVFMDRKESLDFFFDRIETIYCSAVWNKMARTSLFATARYYNGAYCQDLRMMPNILRELTSSITLDEYLVSYMTMRKGSITRCISPKLLFDRMMAVGECLDFAVETGNDDYIKLVTPTFSNYLMAAYYGAWKGTSQDPEERKKQINPKYMCQIKEKLKNEKHILLNKEYLLDAKKRMALRIFCFSKNAFLVYNRIFQVFDL